MERPAKLILAIFTALGLFIIYLLACFPLLNNTVFSWGDNKDSLKNDSQISDNKDNILTFDFKNPVNPEISDYILVSITAKNSGLAEYPYGSIAVNLSEEKTDILNSDSLDNDAKDLSQNTKADSNTEIDNINSTEIYRIQERASIFVDGIRHTYYIPVGENKYYRYKWSIDGPSLKGQISSLEIEIPKIDGVDIQINSIALNKRLIFAADSHINYFFKSYFQLSHIDRYLTPAYIFLILFIAVFFLFRFLLKRTSGNNEGTKANNLKPGAVAALVPLLLLILFSFYFINNYVFTVKGYWDSYKQYIISGRLDETYYGFSDFKKFVAWVGEKVPQDQNVIVLVKGEPIYIMAQMAYGLYPRDIKFIDISKMSAGETADKIKSINFGEIAGEDSIKDVITEADKISVENNNAGLNNNYGTRDYEYVVILSETDKKLLGSVKVRLEYSYRENAGFLYKLILK